MLKTTVLLLILSIFKIGFSQKEVTVFESGKEGFAIFRIPSIINLPNQKIIAFAEGRVNGGADFGNIKLVVGTVYVMLYEVSTVALLVSIDEL